MSLSVEQPAPDASSHRPNPRRRRPRAPRNGENASPSTRPTGEQAGSALTPSLESAQSRPSNGGASRTRRAQNGGPGRSDSQAGHAEPSGQSSNQGGGHGRGPRRPPRRAEGDSQPPQSQPRRARQRFGAQLSNESATPAEDVHDTTAVSSQPVADDLTSHLTRLLSTQPYPDCVICFAPVHPLQPTWSCSLPTASGECCWATLHLKCVKAWATKSTKETRDAYAARGEDREGEWRCPNCQTKRTAVPKSYTCFCGSTPDPKPPRFATPHSCATPCSRARSTCVHGCPLQCHPGPCPPCQITLSIPCFCGKHHKSVRCSKLTADEAKSRTCGETCDKALSCGSHRCQRTCHPGGCDSCEVMVEAVCHCGRESKMVRCGEEQIYACENICDKPFDCGEHRCESRCHAHSQNDVVCPRDPSVVLKCPCGKTSLAPCARTKCTDPIPSCESTCLKPLEGCDHLCSQSCHTGSCPACPVLITRRCRCGSTTADVPCHLLSSAPPLICATPCPALKLCGRHQCINRCCPAASLHKSKSKGKRRVETTGGWQDEIERLEKEELERQWHTCDIACGKMLSCGLHVCEEMDHKGACPPCLRSSFDEMICACGRTVLIPPIPCGTKISCPYPCSRPPPACGHPKTPHSCHEDDNCPPCPYLTKRLCMCGKKEVANVRCSAERVGCGTKCGKLMKCGFHHCEKVCHSDDCGDCTATCGKDRRLCLPNHHPCTLPCHAPSACDESEPCPAVIILRCSCGRIEQPAPCLRCTTSPSGPMPSTPTAGGHSVSSPREIKCNADCTLAQRNARLAEALGISTETRERAALGKEVEYSPELRSFGKANWKFLETLEKAFADFVTSDRKTNVLPNMHEGRRKFVHELAEVYRIATLSVDKEPHRSVQLTRRIDTRIPHPLLSNVLSASLGRLADMSRGIAKPTTAHTPPPAVPSSSGATLAPRGWSSVVVSRSATPVSLTTVASLPVSTPSVRAVTPETDHALPQAPVPSGPILNLPSVQVPAVQPVQPEDVPDDWENDL
ncbi:hypothetical protein SISNIDRAFT_406427 [Sistotremastrum niveocremeum HHB9708]|uniref:R3H domain-containing protein n=1 Tax=Sistotremastrum niveocremeum HHB9708 TaxID=1314777 RepID=A0A164YP87_9AGAM|nr:hypothetical protein SISNIDRAFT_406427 [Sistotremastrum niveocremeum HHB9708]